MALRAVIAWILALFTVPVLAADVNGFRVWTDPDKTRAVLDLESRSDYQVFTLENPPRVVIDLPKADLNRTLTLVDEYAGVIDGVRHGRPDKDTLRIVLDLENNSTVKSFMLDPTSDYGHRLVIDLFPEGRGGGTTVAKALANLPSSDRDVVIAIDPGHGGEDPGAIGKSRTREKDVVLAIARQLKQSIDARPGMSAVLIRTGDYYIPLRDRFEKARKHRADLFVSIHADAFKRRDVSGSSVFVLSRKGASSEFARRLAASENSSDLVGGVTLSDKDDMLASVLLDLSQSAALSASMDVGSKVIRELARLGKVHRRTVQQAGFLVLKSPDMPSILVETAFISNPSEEKKLRDKRHQERLADALLAGIRTYFYTNPPPDTRIAMEMRRVPAKQVRHVIARGDTLSEIAERYNVSTAAIRAANKLSNDSIRVGQTLSIPVYAGT